MERAAGGTSWGYLLASEVEPRRITLTEFLAVTQHDLNQLLAKVGSRRGLTLTNALFSDGSVSPLERCGHHPHVQLVRSSDGVRRSLVLALALFARSCSVVFLPVVLVSQAYTSSSLTLQDGCLQGHDARSRNVHAFDGTVVLNWHLRHKYRHRQGVQPTGGLLLRSHHVVAMVFSFFFCVLSSESLGVRGKG